ncbi:MAG TPA: PilT/PilU family type 4a pilus ATPase [Actinomycetota bacterium]|nr:PilT/PilU family type 4a pilus ATPase [Actinomycetota bacterium]
MDVTELLRHAVEVGASDLHLKASNVPFVRIDGELQPAPYPALTSNDTVGMAVAILPEHKRKEFEITNEADFGYTLTGVGRFRVNVFRQRGMVGLAIRRVRSDVPTIEELLLPPVIADLADSARGLVLVTGPTGTGKTTSIASMIGHINRTRRAHVVTIEDPIEVVHDDHRSIIQQREIGLDTDSYAAALKHVIRQDPDVIFVGEIRDPDSALSAIQAAETGHLVISTLHTIDATETINRLLDLFPPQQQREVRTSFAGALRGIVSQRLVPRADGKGRVPAVEVLVATGRVYDRIVDPSATIEIRDVIAEGGFYGMQTFDQALVKQVRDGLVAEDDARRASTNPHDFVLALSGSMSRGNEIAAAPTSSPARRPHDAPLAPSGAGDSRTRSRAPGTRGRTTVPISSTGGCGAARARATAPRAALPTGRRTRPSSPCDATSASAT